MNNALCLCNTSNSYFNPLVRSCINETERICFLSEEGISNNGREKQEEQITNTSALCRLENPYYYTWRAQTSLGPRCRTGYTDQSWAAESLSIGSLCRSLDYRFFSQL